LRVVAVHGASGEGSAGRDVVAAPAIRRGDIVTLVYSGEGLRVSARTRALHDAAIGGAIRLTNLQSNVTIDAIATGPARASANFDAVLETDR
jgi:flagella basal body P-ring formation protein FlgA